MAEMNKLVERIEILLGAAAVESAAIRDTIPADYISHQHAVRLVNGIDIAADLYQTLICGLTGDEFLARESGVIP